jgi:acylphosphatase
MIRKRCLKWGLKGGTMDKADCQKYEMHAIVKGKVQGVGFRATTHYYAKALGLTGTVKNLSNGHVEIYAQGSKHHLEELMQRLKEEIGNGQFKEAVVEYIPIQIPQVDFRIIHD